MSLKHFFKTEYTIFFASSLLVERILQKDSEP